MIDRTAIGHIVTVQLDGNKVDGILVGWVEKYSFHNGEQEDLSEATIFFPFDKSLSRIFNKKIISVGKLVEVDVNSPD